MSDEIQGEATEKNGALTALSSPMSRRRLIGGAALAVGGAALAACSTSTNGGNVNASTGESLLKTIQSRGKLNVSTTLQYPPEMYKDSSGQPAGYDVEIMKAIAKDLNVTLNVIDVGDNAASIANVQSGKADIIMVGLVNTPKRALVMNFTRGYVPYTQVVIVPNNGGANSVADLNQPGKKITALQASTAFFRCQLLFPKAQVIPLAQDEALLSVATGKADACLVEYYLAAPFIAQHSNVHLMAGGKPVATEFGCIAMLAGDYLFWRWMDNWIAYNTDNSQLPGMYKNIIGLDWVPPS